MDNERKLPLRGEAYEVAGLEIREYATPERNEPWIMIRNVEDVGKISPSFTLYATEARELARVLLLAADGAEALLRG